MTVARPGIKTKTVVLGAESCGKTSLVDRLNRKDFPQSTESTIGARFEPIPVTAKSPDKFEVWDTSSQMKYSELRKLYYRDCHLFILVLDLSKDVTEQFEFFKAELKILDKLTLPLNFVSHLVGTKADLVTNDQAKSRLNEAAKLLEIPLERTHTVSAINSGANDFESLLQKFNNSLSKKMGGDEKHAEPEQANNTIPFVKLDKIVAKYTSSSCFSVLPFFNNNRSEVIKSLQKLVTDKTTHYKGDAPDITYNEVAAVLAKDTHRQGLFNGTQQTNGTSTDAVVSELRTEFLKKMSH